MSPRIFWGWLIITVVTVALTVALGLGRETASFDLAKGEPVFADLRANPDSAARVEVKSRFGEFTLIRESEGWVTPDRNDYPVSETNIRRLIVGLSDMRFIEPKTSDPERFRRLEVQDIDKELADSAYVKVSDGEGKELAEVIIGRPSARFFGGRANGTYIREPGTNNVWLVSGVTNVQTRLVPWLQREIVEIPANTVAKISIGEGETAYSLSRTAADDEAFRISGAPEGRNLDPEKVRPVTRAISGVNFEDVKLRSELSLPADAKVAEFLTFDGLAVRVRLAEIDRKKWAMFEAIYTGDAADESHAAKAALAAVEDINMRVGSWIYWIPSATYTNLTRPVDEILVPKEDGTS
ncbi:MAG: hypothetical protein CL566_07550 [Alphaproteobacteria bacterium]|nr:hypothetical protein [Alphaproteobacteria bacterium]